MKLNKITIQNFLGAKDVNVELTKPVQLFCGQNGAGKSSIQEAVRMALTGESVRVGLKKDYGKLISEGKEIGIAMVVTDNGKYSVTLPNGRCQHVTDCAALPYVLDAQRFAKLEEKAKRSFLFGLSGIKLDGNSVKERMLSKGCNPKKVDDIAPMLLAGFDAAHKEAQEKAREEKAVWRNITGETYGDKKAATWTAETPVFDVSKLTALEEQLSKADADLSSANQHLGALVAAQRQCEGASVRLNDLREKATKYAQIQDKLYKDEDELKALQEKVEATKQSASGGRKVGLIHDMAQALNDVFLTINDSSGVAGHHLNGEIARWDEFTFHDDIPKLLNAYEVEHGKISNEEADPEAKAKLPEYERAMQLMQNTVANGKRDLAEADTAARAIAEVEKTLGSAEDKTKEIESLKLTITEKTGLKTKLAGDINDLARAKNQAEQAQKNTAKSMEAHESVQAWGQIADTLAPSGIPSEMLGEALGPLNQRLKDTAEMTLWSCVKIGSDMGISYGDRAYSLLSESEKWRVDAMISEAIGYVSGVGLLVLDRFDVLDMQGREDLIMWLHVLAESNEINTALIFGTLKAAPSALPPSIQAHWVEAAKQATEVSE